MLYADFALPKEQKLLKFIGYKRPHPLENHIIFAIQGVNDNIDIVIGDVIKPCCVQIIKMLNKIQHEIEGSTYFINELKKT